MPRRVWMSRISARICACVVTSSAVVGSSAIRRTGSRISAMAIMTRWRWPPDSWCGKARYIAPGSGRPTSPIAATTRARRWAADRPVWISSISPIWSPTRATGLSAVIGSWKIIAIFSPRRRRMRRSLCASRSTPSTWMAPATGVRARRSCRPMTVKAVTDLPDPDSPTTQTISPALTVRSMPSTALARSPPFGRLTVRPRTSSTGRPFIASPARSGGPACRAARRPRR